MIELKEDKGTDYVIDWKSKEVYISNLYPLYTVFLHIIKLFRYKVQIKFDKDHLAVEQNNYTIKIVNNYIVYDLDAWRKIPHNNSNIKNYLFGATKIVKIVIKKMYSGCEIAFDGAGSWNLVLKMLRML